MKKSIVHYFALGLLCWLAPGSVADTGQDIFRTTFEDNRPTWVSYGKESRAGITREPVHVKEGMAALQFDYIVEAGSFYGLGKIFKPGQLKDLKSIRFWLKPDGATPFGVLLQEQGGGRYVAAFNVPGDTWQRIELAPSDFSLWQNVGAVPDPNNHLDLDRIEFVAMGDFNQIPAQYENTEMNDLYHVRLGPHVLFIDDIVLSKEPLEEYHGKPGEVTLDFLGRPQTMWVTMGGVKLTRASSELGSALELNYQRVANQPQGIYRLIAPGLMRGRNKLLFNATATRETTLTVVLDEPSGGKYSTTTKIPAGISTEVELPFDQFKPTEESRDNNRKLDIEQVYQISIYEAGVASPPTPATENKLYLSNLRASII